MKKAIVQERGITEFPFIVKDENGDITYYENSDGFWFKRTFDENGKMTYHENSDGFWFKRTFDENGDITYHENSDGDTWGTKPDC